MSNDAPTSGEGAGPDGKPNNAADSRRPSTETRFKPGQSGNPKGRPKGSQNMKTKLRKLYMTEVEMHVGKKKRRVTLLEALHLKQLEQGIKGSVRAGQAAIASAKDLGLYDDSETENDSQGLGLTREMIALLSDEELDELITLEERKLQLLTKH